MASFEFISDILKRQRDEDDPIDVYITLDSIKKVCAFQLKRFGRDIQEEDDATEQFIDFLNNIPNKYSKINETSLLVIFETDKDIDCIKVKECLRVDNYPFNRIMFMGIKDQKIHIGEFWPHEGMDEYELKEFLN